MDRDYKEFMERMNSFPMEIENNDNLIHYGILGMKWGVRRFQNKDGTLTNAGKKRVSTKENLEQKKKLVDSSKDIVKTSGSINKNIRNIRSAKKIDDLNSISDDELRTKVNRLNMERQYSILTSSEISKGRTYMDNTLEIAGNALAVTSSALSIAIAIKTLKG